MRRSSKGSMPRASASSSIADSTPRITWPRPYPRKAPDGMLLVYTDSASTRFTGALYRLIDSAQPWKSTPGAWFP